MMPKTRTIAIVGRPNVGKSTLFNRLIGKREAIETPIKGATRDRLYGRVFWRGLDLEFIDAAGVEHGAKDEIAQSAQEGVRLAIENADLILFLVDWTDKNNEADKSIAKTLRKTNKEVILAVNKADNLDRIQNIDQFKRLGKFTVVPVSAISGKNTGDLLDIISQKLIDLNPAQDSRAHSENDHLSLNLAVIGRPNVGKSTLLNAVVDQKRAITSPVPGTTRDAFAVTFFHKDQKIRIVDTAGIRRPGKIKKDTIESFSVLRSLKALKEADVAAVVIDAAEGLVAADAHILGQAIESGKAAVLAVNKIDLWDKPEEAQQKYLRNLQTKLNFAPWIPVVFISAEKKINLKPLLNQIVKANQNRQSSISNSELAEILEIAKNQNAQLAGLISFTQKKTAPPVFRLTFKGKVKPHYTQIRYLENKLRDIHPLAGTPIFIDL